MANDIERAEAEKIRKAKYLDKIKGSLIGGAAGDALGYAVEFMQEPQIFKLYGEDGITEYSLKNGVALISDDTQMTLFTANAVLYGETRSALRGIGGHHALYAKNFYLDWLTTQTVTYEEGSSGKRFADCKGVSWLLDVPELYSRRAPGNTCLSSLSLHSSENTGSNFIDSPINTSKGCGGVMRTAPVGLYRENADLEMIDMLAAELSAVTHGHPLGYMPSAVFAHIINKTVYPGECDRNLKENVFEAVETVKKLFAGKNGYIEELESIIRYAVELSENSDTDTKNIHKLGEGWVAEEALAIAIYCSLKYQNDFSKGIIAAVNHNGDSDSTGAIAGNILGALNGYAAIDEKWKRNLELNDVISEMAEDLCFGCLMDEYGGYYDAAWEKKYINAHWKKDK